MFLQISEYLLCICVEKLSTPENLFLKTENQERKLPNF